jgi:hypothetical protein
MKTHPARMSGVRIMEDPEAIFLEGWLYCDVGEYEHGLVRTRRALERGYTVAPTLAQAPAFDGIRHDPAFRELLARCEAGRDLALAAYREAGGERLLGV